MGMADWRTILLTLLQTRFPLCERPFTALAEQLARSEDEILDECRRMQSEDILRRLGATFDARRLGYESTLVGAEVPADRLGGLVTELKRLPGVSHCYGRGHTFNVWFTLNATSLTDMESLLAGLTQRHGLAQLINLPAVKIYKLNAVFTRDDDERLLLNVPAPQIPAVTSPVLSKEQKQLVRFLQEDMALRSDFFTPLADALCWPMGTVLGQIDAWRREGIIRRFGATVRHQKLGFGANAMVVFAVEESQLDRAGLALASMSAVSHCYQRATASNWPYNLYAMMHAVHDDDLDAVIRQASAAVGPQFRFEVLLTTAEYKKTTAKFFLEPVK